MIDKGHRQAWQDNDENLPQREHRGHRGQDGDKSVKSWNIGSSLKREYGL